MMLANNGTSFLGLELCDLNLALPVFFLAGFFHAVVFLFDEVKRLGHIFAVLHKHLELTLLFVDLVDSDLGLGDISLLLQQASVLSRLVFPELTGFGLGLGQLFLKLCEQLCCGAGAKLELDKTAVPFLDLLDVLLVGDLHLMEVDELEVISHFCLLLDLSLSLEDGHLECDILLSQLLDLRLLL